MVAPRIDLRRTLGPLVVEWIEANLCHGPGDVQGRPVELDDEQVRFLCAAYAIDDAGRRVVNRAVYSRPKGRAKSELAAMIVCAEALGPVRFSHWDDDGYPVGRRVQTPIIVCAATEEGQADNTYGAVHVMLTEGAVADTPGLDVGLTRTFLPGGGKIHSISARASSKDGGKETFVNFDETHLFISPELHNLAATLRRNLAKRREAQAWSLETSTMYAPGQNSVAESSHRFARDIAAGKTRDPGNFLFDHMEGPDPKSIDWDDDDQLRSALRMAYGDAAEWMDLERLIADARDPSTRRADFVRYFLNRPSRDEALRWVTSEQWDALAIDGARIPAGARIVAAVDVGISNDSTAVVIAGEGPDGRELHECHVWASRRDAAAHEHVSGRVRLAAIEDYLRDLAGRYELLGVAYDKMFFEAPAQTLSDEGLTMVEIVQGSKAMREAEQGWYQAVTADRSVAHNGDPVFAAHVAATVATKTDRGWKLRKMRSEEGGVAAKIDATVASIMAMAVWRILSRPSKRSWRPA